MQPWGWALLCAFRNVNEDNSGMSQQEAEMLPSGDSGPAALCYWNFSTPGVNSQQEGHELTWCRLWSGPWGIGHPYLNLMGFPGDTSGEQPACQCRRCNRRERHGFDPWVGKIPGGGHSNPLQYSYLENPMDRGAWWATVQGVTKSRIHLSMHSYQNSMEVGEVKIDTPPREKRSCQLLKRTLCSLVLGQ